MSRVIKNLIILFIIIISITQSLAIYKFNKIINSKSIVVQGNTSIEKDLLDFNEELGFLEKMKILSANKIDGDWHIKLQIEGDKEHIIGELSKLEIYNINSYSIKHVNNINEVIVEIIDKNNV